MTSSSKRYDKKIKGILDAIFASAGRPISIRSISKILKMDRQKTEEILEEYIKSFNSIHEGIKIRRKRNFYYLIISEKYIEYARPFLKPPPLTDRQRLVLAYIYHKKEILQRDLSKIFGPSVYRDLKKLRALGLISILKRNNKKVVLFRNEAEAYIIKRKGYEKIESQE